MGLLSGLKTRFGGGAGAAGGGVAPPTAGASLGGLRGRLHNAFAGASYRDPDIASWQPGDFSGHGAIAADRSALALRVHDLARNDGWASSSVTKLVDTLVGGGWILIATPNARTLGITEPKVADEFAADIEAAWDDFVDDPDCWADVQRTHPFGLLTALAMRHRVLDGEALGAIQWRDRGGPYATCLNVIDPDRLSTPFGQPDTPTMKSGVELDADDGAVLAYNIRVGHPADGWLGGGMRWERLTRDVPGVGRRQVVHAFEPTRAGERRGFPPLAPVLKKFRMLGRYDETEMQAALLNAVMAAFIESPNDPEDLAKSLGDTPEGDEEYSEYQAARLDFHERNPMRMGGAKVNFLYSGEKATFTNPTHPNAVYDPFVRVGLRNIAAAAGQTYEQFTGDLSQVNYSSIRAGLVEVKKGFTARKTHFAGQFMQPFYAAWLQEALARGRVKPPPGCPPFLAAKTAYCGADWIGPGMGWVDPLKEAQAVRERLSLRITTRRREAAEQGFRFRQIIAESASEDADMRAAGLDPTVTASKAPASDGSIQQAGENPPPAPDAPPEK